MTPYMTEDEIIRLYNGMADTQDRVKILSQLCASDEDYIRAVVGLIPEAIDNEPIEVITPNNKKSWRGVDYKYMDSLLKKKYLTLQDIATFVGCSKALVCQYLKQNRNKYPHRIGRVINSKWK